MKKLQEMRAQRKLNNKGFSLVELIIVIAIMAVLIAILAPQFIKYVEKSRQSADLDTVEEVVTSVNTVYSDPDMNINGSGATIIVTTTGTGVTAGPTDLDDKLKELNAMDGKLKSKQWGTVTIKVASEGSCSVESAGGSINMKDKYKK